MTGTGPASVPDGARVMPVLIVPSAATAGPLADALAAGGARCAEVTSYAERAAASACARPS